ncbi:MAG: biopolymer transporter ExbD [Deltaproteobacteria bacterium]|nr:biopolymer transporter ExbD [Deltaproteobacteria bacterium]
MKTLGGKGGKMITEINVTPLVDVMLVLLVIFMVTATYIVRGSIGMKLPTASTADQMSRSPMVVGVDEKGNFLVEGKVSSEAEVVAYIEGFVARDPEVEAVISGDKSVQYGRVMDLINLARKHGVKNFAAAVEKKPER